MMKNLDTSAKISLGIAFVFLVALIISQWCFHKKIKHFVNEIKELHIQRDSVLALLDTSKVSTQFLTLHQENQKFQTERFSIELEKQKQQLFWYNVSFLGIGTLLGFLTLLFWIPKEIEKRAKLEVDEKIVDAIRGRSDTIRNMLTSYDKETYLLQNKRIFIDGGDGKEKIQKILQENGFSPNNIFINEDEASKNGYDAIFINNINGDLLSNPPQKAKPEEENEKTKTDYEQKLSDYNKKLDDIIEKIKKEKRDICFFYYNETRVIFPTDKLQYDLQKRVNFATNPAQIYGNLLNTLKYQDKLTQQKH